MATTELRLLSLGELLDRTFSYYRSHFWLFVGIMAIPQLFLLAVNLLRILQIPFLVTLVAYLVAYVAALGATTYALSAVHLGHPATIRSAFRPDARTNLAADQAEHFDDSACCEPVAVDRRLDNSGASRRTAQLKSLHG